MKLNVRVLMNLGIARAMKYKVTGFNFLPISVRMMFKQKNSST